MLMIFNNCDNKNYCDGGNDDFFEHNCFGCDDGYDDEE